MVGFSLLWVIDGVNNDIYLDEGEIYNDFRRNWDAGAKGKQ
jgi:hypothetical protein